RKSICNTPSNVVRWRARRFLNIALNLNRWPRPGNSLLPLGSGKWRGASRRMRSLATNADKLNRRQRKTHNEGRGCPSEFLTIRGQKIVEAEVYFGWSIPHEAPDGEFIDERDR